MVSAFAGIAAALYQHFVAAKSTSCNLTLADKIVVLSAGRVEQVGTPSGTRYFTAVTSTVNPGEAAPAARTRVES